MAFQRPLIEIFNFLGEHAPRLSTPPPPKKVRPPSTLQLFFPACLDPQNLTLRPYKRQLAVTPRVAAS